MTPYAHKIRKQLPLDGNGLSADEVGASVGLSMHGAYRILMSMMWQGFARRESRPPTSGKNAKPCYIYFRAGDDGKFNSLYGDPPQEAERQRPISSIFQAGAL